MCHINSCLPCSQHPSPQVKAGLVPLLADLRARGKAPSGALRMQHVTAALFACHHACRCCCRAGTAPSGAPHLYAEGWASPTVYCQAHGVLPRWLAVAVRVAH